MSVLIDIVLTKEEYENFTLQALKHIVPVYFTTIWRFCTCWCW